MHEIRQIYFDVNQSGAVVLKRNFYLLPISLLLFFSYSLPSRKLSVAINIYTISMFNFKNIIASCLTKVELSRVHLHKVFIYCMSSSNNHNLKNYVIKLGKSTRGLEVIYKRRLATEL